MPGAHSEAEHIQRGMWGVLYLYSMPINAAWHKAHVMPKNASVEQRIKWHLAHAKHCACRPIPEKLQAEINKRKKK